MEIRYKNYRIIPTEAAPGNFDLQEIVTRKSKADNSEYEGFNDKGYGMKFDSCINKIIHIELMKKNEILTLQEFLREFKKESEQLNQELQKQTKHI